MMLRMFVFVAGASSTVSNHFSTTTVLSSEIRKSFHFGRICGVRDDSCASIIAYALRSNVNSCFREWVRRSFTVSGAWTPLLMLERRDRTAFSASCLRGSSRTVPILRFRCVDTGYRAQFIGKETAVATLATMANTLLFASLEALNKYKPGDQIAWTIFLNGRATTGLLWRKRS